MTRNRNDGILKFFVSIGMPCCVTDTNIKFCSTDFEMAINKTFYQLYEETSTGMKPTCAR